MVQSFRRLTLVGCVLAGAVRPAGAQNVDAPVPHPWDATVSIGLLAHDPETPAPGGYRDDWYHAAAASVSVGRYWTPHLRTELEGTVAAEGRRYIQQWASLPGVPAPVPYSAEEYRRLGSISANVGWQFLDNQWAHPYVQAGMAVDWDRSRIEIDPRLLPRALDILQLQVGPRTRVSARGIVSSGAKLYVTTRSYVRLDARAGFGRRFEHLIFRAGVGIDF